MTSPLRYFVELSPAGAAYEGRIHRGQADRSHPFTAPALGRDAKIPGWPGDLGTLLEGLAAPDEEFVHAFDARLQIELGKHLWTQTFGQIENLGFEDEADVEVQIVTEDEHVARLPWALLNRRGLFLCALGWSVSLTRPAVEQMDYLLPPSPKLLVVAPEPAGWPATRAASHLEELERMLGEADHRFRFGNKLLRVDDWDDIGPALEGFQPDLLYYYGHGKGDLDSSCLVFIRGTDHEPREVPVADFAQKLHRAAGPQLLFAYVNCCQGDAGGLLGAGWQLGELVPAVVTNRTVTYVTTAQAQALELWRDLLLRGEPPHRTVSMLHARIETPGQSFNNTRWMNPVLHRRYASWTANPPQPRSLVDRDPHWNVKLDRSNQFARVYTETSLMLHEKRPRALAYFWYGEEGQGVALFHQRLQVELQELMKGALLLEVKPRWPDELRNSYRSFADMLVEACEIQDLSVFSAWVRAQSQFDRRRSPLIHVRHDPLRYGDVVKPSDLKTYLELWNERLAPALAEANAFGLVGVSFLAQKNPAQLRDLLREALAELDLDDVLYQVLDELEDLVLDDLVKFLRTHNVPMPRGARRDKLLIHILEKTGGQYEMTLEELKRVVDLGLDDEAEAAAEPAPKSKKEPEW